MTASDTPDSTLVHMDVLLLSQLLHARGIEDAAALQACDDAVLAGLFKEWNEHPSFGVYRRSPPPLDKSILLDTYPKLLAQYLVILTTALANCAYHIRLKELDDRIEECRAEFERVSKEDP